MKTSHFKVKSRINLEQVKEGDVIPTSDFASLTPSGHFVQLQYVDVPSDEIEKLDVHPGIFTISKTSMGLRPTLTSFVDDKIMSEFLHTKEIENRVDSFFRNLHKYKKWGIEVPRRGGLIYGDPGGGKTVSITQVIKKQTKDNDMMVLLWDSNKYEAHNVKDLIRSFNYVGVKKMILVIEDIGGGEMSDRRSGADTSLLSLLDNQEKTFIVPIYIIATTNHPANFMAALTNRSGRFDDKIEVGPPPGKVRRQLLKFFGDEAGEVINEDALKLIESNECSKFPPAHIREVVIRADIHEKTHVEVINEMIKEIKKYNKAFEDNQGTIGFGRD